MANIQKVVAACSVWLGVAWAPVQAQSEEIWLVNTPTYASLSRDQLRLDVVSRYTRYQLPDVRGEVADFFLSLHYGVSDRSMFIFTVPFVWIDNLPGRFGIGDVSVGYRHTLWQSDLLGLALAPRLYLPTGDASNLMGSDRVGFQLAAYLGAKLGAVSLHAGVAYGDRGYVRSQFYRSRSGSLSYASQVVHAGILSVSGAATWRAARFLLLAAEGTGNLAPEFSDHEVFVQLGAILTIGRFRLRGSGGIGLPPDERRAGDLRATFGVGFVTP